MESKPPRRPWNWLIISACATGAASLCGFAFAQSAYVQAGGGDRLIVVELYTSQACSSCPPADQLQAELSERPDVLPLTFPVDYWDYLGWHDTLARPLNAQRQMAYAKRSQSGRVYTPQIVIDGRFSAIGSRRGEVLARIADRRAAQDAAIPISMVVSADEVSVSVAADPAWHARHEHEPDVSVWLFPFAKSDTVHISQGENRGHSVRYFHVVRDIVMLGEWTGQAANFEHSLAEHDQGQFGYAVVLQRDGAGPIVGAAWAADRKQIAPAPHPPAPPMLPDPLLVNLEP
jgi:hypothetical protein